jgi:GTP cyclohydrolase II
LTNNPKKVTALEAHGIRVTGRIPHVIPANEHNRFYLQTKANRSGHLMDIPSAPTVSEQDDPVLVEEADSRAGG